MDKLIFNQWQCEESSPFGIGKFWSFVISGLFTFIALFSVYIMAYFAVYGENAATYYLSESAQVIAANSLLWRMEFIQNFLWAVFVISLLVIFRDYIELLWAKLRSAQVISFPALEIPLWVYRGLRYSILILFTLLSFLTIYEVALIVPSSLAGSAMLTSTMALGVTDSGIKTWCTLAAMYDIIAVGLLMCWICSVWLMAFGYMFVTAEDLEV